jgi:HNH endonuclease
MAETIPSPNPGTKPQGPPRGHCQCGCGQETSIARQTDPKWGWVRGQPVRYVQGHNQRKTTRYIEVDTGHSSPCWIWQLAKTPKGYGLVRGPSGRMEYAHRVYYERDRGPIPADRQLDHLCRVPGCVNPDHLDPVTAAENIRRGAGTKLTKEDVREIRVSTELQDNLARRYGVSQPHISRIKSGQTWR